MPSTRGFIVSAWDERAGSRIFATGRLCDGKSFAAVLRAPSPAIYVSADAAHLAHSLLAGATIDTMPWTSFDGRALSRITLGGRVADAERRLAAAGVHVHHVDAARANDVLLGLGIRGPVEIRGETTTGRRVDVVFVDPVLAPSPEVPALRWLAIDVEADREGAITSISTDAERWTAGSERELLTTFIDHVKRFDPDVITGWNVLEDDLAAIARRCTAYKLPFDIGRVPGNVELVTRRSGRLAIDIPGRTVVDAMRIVRGSGEHPDDESLDGDPARLLHVLAKTGLDHLTVRRAALTGVALDLAWTSIPGFDRVYGAALHARNIVPPPRTDRYVDGAAGGTVLDAEAGIFANVLVFDFRSLYPSLMRTFNIDPLAHARAAARPQRDSDIVAPNGARFDRSEGILPAILTAYAREREAALSLGDDVAAYVYKILQNSFYGVLGASGCRYARSELAGAITSFGKQFLTTARDWFEARGYHVIYGDTDSVFVQFERGAGYAELLALATKLAGDLNRFLAAEIRASFDLDSHLLIRCDKIYSRFFISRLRGDASADGRGRGKGYAGLRLDERGDTELEVRGMEAVRSDFTPLARRFQRELMALLFADADIATLRAFCAATATRLTRGELDAELVYRKVLRRAAGEYESETPQVRAARLLGWHDRGGPIEYVMTRDGAEPILARASNAPLDYEHYRDRQLIPIAQAIANVLGTDVEGWFNDRPQLALSLG